MLYYYFPITVYTSSKNIFRLYILHVCWFQVPDNIPQNQEAASSGTKRVHTEVIDDEFVALKKQKLKLEIENLELKNCKLRYQVRWLERKESDLEADEIDSSATF